MPNHTDTLTNNLDWQVKLNEPIDLASFHSLDIPEMDWVVSDMFAVSQSGLLTSSTGKGKSLNAQMLSICIATGKPFGSFFVPKPRKTLYLDGEMHPKEFQDRERRCSWITDRDWEKLTQNLFYWSKLYGKNFPDLSDEKTWERLISFCMKEKIEVLIVDNYFSMTRMKDYNAPQEAQKLQDLFIDPLKAFGISILMVDHLNKSGTEYGTLVKQAGVEFILRISYDKESQLFTMASQKGRTLGMGQKDMVYRITTDGNEVVALDMESAKTLSEQKAIEKNKIGNKFKELYEDGYNKSQTLRDAMEAYKKDADIDKLLFKFDSLRNEIPLWIADMGFETELLKNQ